MKPIEKALLRAMLANLRAVALNRAIAQRWVSFEITLEITNSYGYVAQVTFVHTHQLHTIAAIDDLPPVVWRSGFAPDNLVVALAEKFLSSPVPTFPEVAA
jgi:hypothetical protein